MSASGQIGSLGGSIVGSTDWMVLHRPLELARLIGHSDSGFAIDSRYCFSSIYVETLPVGLLSATVVIFFPSGETVILSTVSILPSRL